MTDKQVEEENTAEMIDSQQEAIAVALRALGKQVTERVTIAKVAQDAPSAAELRQGDEIVSVDGQKVDQLRGRACRHPKHPPGEAVTLMVPRSGSP